MTLYCYIVNVYYTYFHCLLNIKLTVSSLRVHGHKLPLAFINGNHLRFCLLFSNRFHSTRACLEVQFQNCSFVLFNKHKVFSLQLHDSFWHLYFKTFGVFILNGFNLRKFKFF